MGKRWMYGTPNPGRELTLKDKIYVGTVVISSLLLLGVIGYMLIQVLN